MTKRNFKPPGLTHKNKWSQNFHDFLTQALQKEPRKRPTAHDLLKVQCILLQWDISIYVITALIRRYSLDVFFIALLPMLMNRTNSLSELFFAVV